MYDFALTLLAVGDEGPSLALLNRWQAAIDAQMASLGFTGEAVLRLFLACVAGGLIGLEREIRGHEAGFRTFLLVSFGAALAMVVSQSLALSDWSRSPLVATGGLQVDPGRIAYGVMTGVGFLGAGTIIQRRGNVRGLTTAAGIWSAAALGLTWGFGLYVIGGFATLSLLAALLLLGVFEDYLPQQEEQILRIRVPWSVDCAERVAQLARDHRLNVRHLRMTRRPSGDTAEIRLVVKYFRRERFLAFQHEIETGERTQLLGIG